MPSKIPNVLSIAGSDPSGGAGIQADLKTISAMGCYGMAALTALTAQNTRGVRGVQMVPAAFVDAQIEAVLDDVEVAAIKTGMLGTAEIVEAVAAGLARRPHIPLVLDPVLVATSGDDLGGAGVVDAVVRSLLPRASVITPNLPEAARLAGEPVPKDEAGMRRLAERLHRKGASAVLIKGGHLSGPDAVDILYDGIRFTSFRAARVETRNTHGTGCTLASAIACHLARGRALVEAVDAAKTYLTEAIRTSGSLEVGRGQGPVNHFHALWTGAGA